MRTATAMLFLLVEAANPQQVGQNAPASSAATTFQSSTQLVVETVSVKDKNGNPVENLTAKDFAVTEDGVAQTIRFFEFQKMQGTSPAPSASAGRASPFPKLPKSHIAPEAPGNMKYRDHRLLALYFDMSAMPPGDPCVASPSGASAIKPRASMGQNETPARMAALIVAWSWAWLSTPFNRRPLAK